jgi:hypothetical protein
LFIAVSFVESLAEIYCGLAIRHTFSCQLQGSRGAAGVVVLVQALLQTGCEHNAKVAVAIAWLEI